MGPRINSSGTPSIYLSHSLNESPALQDWYLFVTQLESFIIITSILFLLLKCVFQFSAILSSAYCVLQFSNTSERFVFQNFVSLHLFNWLGISLSKTFEKLDKMLQTVMIYDFWVLNINSLFSNRNWNIIRNTCLVCRLILNCICNRIFSKDVKREILIFQYLFYHSAAFLRFK